jgi:hypothetical protein
MNDVTNQQPQTPTAPSAPPPLRAIPLIPIKLVDAREPFVPLANLPLSLSAVPRPGDGITIDLQGRRVFYRVAFVNLDPYDNFSHVTVGCSLDQPAATGRQVDPAKLNEFIQTQEQTFQKAEAYSKTIITLGYAGLFALWAFVKDHLSPRAIVLTATLVGFSLLIYIIWEVALMFQRAWTNHQFNKALKESPSNPGKAINDFNEQTRANQVRDTKLWLVVLALTVGPGFGGAIILLYNCFAALIGLPQRP